MDTLTATDLILIFLISKPIFILGTFLILATQRSQGAPPDQLSARSPRELTP